MPQPVKKNHRYISGLDGLRAISVLAVILYHLHFPWIYGGYLGVTIFFVLSGYLITDLLINEYQKTGTIDFKSFWIRRLRRLLPALFVMLILVTVWITLFQRDYLTGLRGEIGAAFVYISNWYYVWQDHSYFTKFSPPSPLQHMWSLAVEEQFYIVWPIIMLLALRFTKSSGKLAFLVMLLSVVSAELMAFLFSPGEDPSRVYYGTDTRAFSLLIGAALAIVWPSRRLKPNVAPNVKRALDITGAVAFIAMILFIIFLREESTFLYYGGMYLASAIVAVLIAVLVHPASVIGDILSWRPLLWVGVRSYGIYIWHFPILVLLGLGLNTGDFVWWRVLLAVVLTFGLSAVSWKYLEDPIRKGEWRGWLKHAHPRNWSLNILRWSGRTRVANTLLIVILAVFTVGLIIEPSPQASGNKALEEHLEKEQKNLQKEMTPEEKKEAARQARIAEREAAKQAAKEKSEKARRALVKFNKDAKNARKILADTPITAIGDSVMLSAATDLRMNMPGVTVDAVVGRQVSDAIDVLKVKQANGQIANTVLIGLGSNGTFTEQQFEEIYNILGEDRRIYLINVRVPREWQSSVNKTLSDAAKKYDNVMVIDWYHKSKKRKNILYNDKTHPNVVGAKYYADVVGVKISKTINK